MVGLDSQGAVEAQGVGGAAQLQSATDLVAGEPAFGKPQFTVTVQHRGGRMRLPLAEPLIARPVDDRRGLVVGELPAVRAAA
ncbi:hypothetical protein [Streptomyces asoensis]|uniref:Uncharacterized protein n=1 Tax=Streptomyces asoensis TaxID=249586 RepID=A0ABQ3S5W2_9ACTN|nr:hypothetical protein [Streptomyces asoensis]GGQ80368.1 hypothetical protein GCM10010496_50190 [Streptomyces asoensis]GHI63494.1 hypothetical protein Saso_51440 [Streptomyces asoensis]